MTKHVLDFIILWMFLCAGQVCAQDISSQQALLMVHFGTTYDETRQQTIDAINEKARSRFSDMVVREAYTSRVVMKRLCERGIVKETPTDAMLRLRGEGYRRLIIQPSFVIDGREMEMLRKEADQLRPFFDEILIGTPLLYSVDDAMEVCRLLVSRHPADKNKCEHVLFVGHGTEGPATALYSQLDYMLRADGPDNYHVATIEGYPTQQTALDQIKALRGRKVILVPLLFVAGDHASNDISGEWKEELEQQGLNVELHIEGLGEVPEIQNLYIG